MRWQWLDETDGRPVGTQSLWYICAGVLCIAYTIAHVQSIRKEENRRRYDNWILEIEETSRRSIQPGRAFHRPGRSSYSCITADSLLLLWPLRRRYSNVSLQDINVFFPARLHSNESQKMLYNISEYQIENLQLDKMYYVVRSQKILCLHKMLRYSHTFTLHVRFFYVHNFQQ